ncbi:PHD finger protein At1g33420-like [Nicotiana tabacum]|uniref:PHD finger protein At1g33420-like n=1 Tax=Nicotiana tabacum TaxID=4097 RepID=A0A1S4BQD0_TOBAC|nr:PHD finger protein At1g33420 [Nicotiana tomentosiformis]XP_016491099.1 PREDICTED: PHD finger protein At1g33420-like [Nicotiana tabacum]
MVVMNGRPMKRLKRRVTADLNDFLTFPDVGNIAGGSSEPFRTTVKAFLSKHALLPPPSSLFPHLLTWQILFRVGDLTNDVGDDDSSPAVVCLDVIEEDVARSRSVYCDQCRVVGWSSNPVCAKRFHFIIKRDGNSIGGYNKPCAGCGEALHLSESRCKSCNHVMTTEDVEDWMYHQLEDNSHLLHAVIHSNGYGHLLRVNGREGGSRLLSGNNIMNFWDRLCKVIGARKISVMDVSKKYGLELRLLHSLTKGHPWYSEWGYQFGAGSFGLTQNAYKQAVENLSSLPLTIFLSQGRKPRTRLQDLISFYQSLSEGELVNIRDLFVFLTSSIRDARKSALGAGDNATCKKRKLCDSKSKVLCAWTSNDVLRVEEAMFRVLRAVSGSNWVSWRALRGAVCKAGPPELLDCCLKELNGKQAADGMVVNARCVNGSGAMEYKLERGNPMVNVNTNENRLPCAPNFPSEEHLRRDLKYLYECMLNPQTMLNHIPLTKREVAVRSARIVLDCKQFMKEYQPERFLPIPKSDAIQLLCEVDIMEQSDVHSRNPPPELMILPSDATISDLKAEATRTFQDVYLMFRRFQADELVGYSGLKEATQVKLLLGSAEFVTVRGKFLGKNALSRYRMERGVERWTVDCFCGAKDDDGERMLACDVCGVWQHTRCAGIPDLDAVPARFICLRCRCVSQTTNTSGNCKDESVAGGARGGLGKSLTNAV